VTDTQHGGSDGDLDQVVADLIRGLEKMPHWPGISFRGATAGDSFLTHAGVLVSQGLTATSRDSRVATENFTTPGIYAFLGVHGRAIEQVSAHPEEREVVFLPGSLFSVATTVRYDTHVVTVVEELDLERDPDSPKSVLDDVLRDVAAHLQRDRDASTLLIASPGKFAGDVF